MPNVFFKRGTQAALNTLIAGSGDRFVDGSFYLTTDTDRLYVAQSASELVELNKSITIVTAISDLPVSTTDNSRRIKGSEVAVGQFYYITGNGGANTNNRDGTLSNGNILAVCSAITGTTITWTQVNPDTDTNDNDNTKVTSISATKNTSESNASKLVFDLSLGQVTSHIGAANTNETAVTGTLTINLNDVTGILTNTAVAVDNSAVSNGSTTINTSGNGADGSGFTIEAGTNVQLADTATGFSISATDTKYTIASPAVSGATTATSSAINLGISGGNGTAGGTITINAGDALAIDDTTANALTIYHKSPSGLTAGSYGTSASATPAAGGKIKVPTITVDAQGHLTAAGEQEITLPADNNTWVQSVTAANDGTFSVTHTGSHSNTVTSGAVLYHTITVDGVQLTKYNQNSLGSFYSAAKIDELLQGINAVTYKGTFDAANDSLPTTHVHIGDAYLASSDGSPYNRGDLIIATAQSGADEDANGELAAADIVWTVVPSGADADTQYTFSVDTSNHKVTYHTNINATEQDLVDFNAGTDIALSTSNKTITINHDTVSRTDTGTELATANIVTSPTASGTIQAVTGITTSNQGHVTSVRYTEFTLPPDNNTTYTMSTAAAASTPQITLTPSTGSANSIQFNAGTAMSVSAPSADNITIAHANVSRNGDSSPAQGSTGTALTAGATVDVVTGVASNDQGHITGVTTTRYQLPGDNNTTYTMGVTAGTAAINLTPSSGSTSSVTISSDSLDVTATSNDIAIDLVWGTF